MIEAIRLNPSLSVPRAVIGSAHILSGEPELGITPLLTALRLNPHDLYLFHLLGELAVAHYMLGCWDEAIGWCNSSLSLRPGYWYPRAIMIGGAGPQRAIAARPGGASRIRHSLPQFPPRVRPLDSVRRPHVARLPAQRHEDGRICGLVCSTSFDSPISDSQPSNLGPHRPEFRLCRKCVFKISRAHL